MSDREVVSAVKNKRTHKKEEEVTCWNCFTTEDDCDVEPLPLTKIREGQREKFKLYSFLASELSKPKAVSLKQKVSEHYIVGKKIDEKICQNVEVSQYLQNNSELRATTGTYLTRNLVSTTSQTSPKVTNKLIPGIRRKVDKSTETDINITIVKLTRSDSSSSSSTTPDFRPRRKLLPKPSTNSQKIEDTKRTKSEASNLSSSRNIDLEVSSKSLSRDNVDSRSKLPDPVSKIVEPISQRKITVPLPGSEYAEEKSQNNRSLDKNKSKHDITDVSKNTSRLCATPQSKTPEQKRSELLTIGKKILNPSMTDSRSKLYSTPSTSSELTPKKATSTESLKEKTLSLKQRLRERYSLDFKTTPKKSASISDDKQPQDKISSPTGLSKSIGSLSLKKILNEHYTIDKEIDETIAKYADLTKSKANKTDIKEDITGSPSESPTGRVLLAKDTGIMPRYTGNQKDNKDEISRLFNAGSKTITSLLSSESDQDKTLSNEEIDKFSDTLYEQIKTSTPKTESRVSTESGSKMFDSVDKEIDEMISKCAVLSISDKKEEQISEIASVSNVITPIKTLERSVGETKTYPVSRIPIKNPSPVAIRKDSSVLSRISKLQPEVNVSNKHVSSEPSLTKRTSPLIRKRETDVVKPKNESLLFAQKLLHPENKEGAVMHSEKTDNTSSNGSESGYGGSSATAQDIQEMEAINKEFEENIGSKNNLSKGDTPDNTLRRQTFKSSLPVLNRIVEKRILKTTTTSRSLNTDINNAGIKPQSQPKRWSTLSTPPKTLSLQDEVYLSDNATLSSGTATLPRRSSSPLPHDTDRFPINRSGLQARSESMASVYSGAGEGARGGVAVRGEVQFSLLYNYRLGALEVGVRRARDLAPVDTKRNRSDPYVKVYLLPDKSKTGKRKTKVKKNTLNPVFEETLSFVQPLAALSARTLWLSVWHADIFGRNDFLGEVTLPLADVVFDDPAPTWYKLHERTEQFEEQQGSRGDLIIGLKFECEGRGKGTLHVLVKEAKNLVATKPNGLADVFCKSYLLPERGRLAKQKTGVWRRSLSPRWEHTFTYRGLAPAELAARALELSLWDRDRLAANDFMGAVRLSLGTGTYMGASVNWMDSVGKEVTLWQTMMQRPNFWVEGSLPLRPQLNN